MSEIIHRLLFTTGCRFLPVWLPWLGALIILVFFERLSDPPHPFDLDLLRVAHESRSLWLDYFFIVVTEAGSLWLLAPLTVLIAAMLARNGRRGAAWLLTLSFAGAAVFSRLAKLWFLRPRPDYFPPVGHLLHMPHGLSYPTYPSGHAAQIAAFVLALWWILKPKQHGWRYFALMACGGLLIMLVAASRIYLQYHYPSDVFGGAVLAILWARGLFNLLQILGIALR